MSKESGRGTEVIDPTKTVVGIDKEKVVAICAVVAAAWFLLGFFLGWYLPKTDHFNVATIIYPPNLQDIGVVYGETICDNKGCSKKDEAIGLKINFMPIVIPKDFKVNVTEYLDPDNFSVPTIDRSNVENTLKEQSPIKQAYGSPFALPVCNPPGGSIFAVGNTTVTCTLTEGGTTSTTSFVMEVERYAECAKANELYADNESTIIFGLCGLHRWVQDGDRLVPLKVSMTGSDVTVRSGALSVFFHDGQMTFFNSSVAEAMDDPNSVEEAWILMDNGKKVDTESPSTTVFCDNSIMTADADHICNNAVVRLQFPTNPPYYSPFVVEYVFAGDGSFKPTVTFGPGETGQFTVKETLTLPATKIVAGDITVEAIDLSSTETRNNITNINNEQPTYFVFLNGSVQLMNMDMTQIFGSGAKYVFDVKEVGPEMMAIFEYENGGPTPGPFGDGIALDPTVSGPTTSTDYHITKSDVDMTLSQTSGDVIWAGTEAAVTCTTGNDDCIHRGVVNWDVTGFGFPANSIPSSRYIFLMYASSSYGGGAPGSGRINAWSDTVAPPGTGETAQDTLRIAWDDAFSVTPRGSPITWSPFDQNKVYNGLPGNQASLDLGTVGVTDFVTKKNLGNSWYALGFTTDDNPPLNSFSSTTSYRTVKTPSYAGNPQVPQLKIKYTCPSGGCS